MAVRLINLHQQPLRVDLRGGGVVLLAAGQRSAALREELLYDNCHLPVWERVGWIAREPARMSDVMANESAPPVAAEPPAPAAKRKAASAKSAPPSKPKPVARKGSPKRR